MSLNVQDVVELLQKVDPTFETNSTFDTEVQAIDAFKVHLAKPKKKVRKKKAKK
jgi:hypothetical protein